MDNFESDRLGDLVLIAWQALITAQPGSNVDALAVKAVELAKAFYKVEQALIKEIDGKAS